MSVISKISKSLIALVTAGMLLPAVAHAAPMNLSPSNEGHYFFRYKVGNDLVKAGNPLETKDIVAYYIGGVGFEFSEKLPIKPQWLGLTWKVVKGSLPDGIKFDNTTRIFSGIPTAEDLDNVVEMIGYGADGVEEATAQLNFDIVDMLGDGRQVTLYAHTGKYKYDELEIPAGVTVDTWSADAVMSLPPGITVQGPYFQGIPTQAGRYPILIRGMDYAGDVVLTYLVNYVVEDGPTFDVIADNIKKLRPAGLPDWQWSGFFDFGAPNPNKINYAIDPTKKVRYFLRIDDENGSLPGKIKSNSDPLDLRLTGFVTEPYDTVRAHFHAIDSDGTTGNSNTFTFGTGDPSPLCRQFPYAPEFVTFYTGREVKTQLAVPFGNQGTVKFTLTKGSLPDGLSLEDGGRIVGMTKVAQPKTPVSILVEVMNDEATLTAECNYTLQVLNEKLKLVDSTPAQGQHGRVGAPYSGQISVKGGIPDFTIDWTAGVGHPTLEAAVPAENQVTVPVRGSFDKPGLPVSYSFTVVNGDTNTGVGDLDLYGYGPLSFGEDRNHVPNYTVKRLDYGNWGQIPYDTATVVPDTSGSVAMPVLALGSSYLLPDGIVFDGRKFGGMTSKQAGQYGPFRITMSDYTKESFESEAFYVDVVAREENVVTSAPDQVFMVEQSARQFGARPVVKYPAGAINFTRTWKLEGPALPAWAHFDPATGQISADAGVPFGDLQQPANQTEYGPYTLTVSDNDPIEPSTSAPSKPFQVRLTDLKAPSALPVAVVKGTVSGDADAGFSAYVQSMVGLRATQQKTVTTINVRNFNSKIDPMSIVGTIDQVVFTHAVPEAPAGVPLRISPDGHSAWLEGSPTEAFNGIAQVFFKDIRGRVGFVPVPMEIKPYPTASMTSGSYDLPRLAPAVDYNIKPNPCLDCWSNPTWEIDAAGNGLPQGLSLDPRSGVISGSTEEVDDETPGTRSPFSGIVLKATSKGASGESLVSWTDPFEINVKPRVPMTLDYPGETDVWYLNDKSDFTSYSFNARNLLTPHVGGSHRPAVTFEADTSALLPTQGLNGTNGVFTWDPSALTLGRWSTEVTATDAEGQKASDTLEIKATLEGEVQLVSGGGSIKLRQSESFMTGDPLVSSKFVPPIVVKNVVEPMNYTIAGNPATVRFLSSGIFLEGSRFDQVGTFFVSIGGKDADERAMTVGSKIQYVFETVPPLLFQPASGVAFTGRQYSVAEPIAAAFPKVDNVLDMLEYDITAADGSDIPGTVVYKVYDSNGQFGHWQWRKANGSGEVVMANDPLWKSKLPLDALVFDQADMSLRGIPSKSGTFTVKLTAKDTYRNSYIHQDDANYPAEKRDEYNTSSTEVTLDIAPAHPLEIVNQAAGKESSAETIAQYTQRPSMRGVVSNAAYGMPLTWTPASGTNPEGITTSTTSVDLAFGGYAENKGTFGNISYKGVDRAGREITSQPVTFTVVDRKPLELVATANPKKMAVFLTDAALSVSPVNNAYGRSIGKANWSVTGRNNLPPGVGMVIEDRGVSFSGTSPTVGSYGPVVVSGVDALGSRASISLTFEVRIPDGPIVLEVSEIKTKQTYPFQMQATATNTYGAVRFYSYALTGSYGKNMTLDESTGYIAGKFDEPQRFSIDTYVTDETNRVTSRPVNVEVIPFIRVTVPQTVKATETIAMTQTIATDYVLGTVAYEKGRGTWPDNLSVDSTTGTISGISTSEPGTFSGLTVKATDTFTDPFGNTYTDTKESNVFEIALDGIPDIADVDSTVTNRAMLYTKDTAAAAWVPKVIDKITKKTWDLPNTTYSINKDFEYETGLTFDTATGGISGTPTKLVVYSDLAITVTSPHGNTDTTKPFWFAVQPPGSIWAKSGQKDNYNNRVGALMTTEAPVFENTVGEVVYTATGLPAGLKLDRTTGVVSGTPTTVATSSIVIEAKDGASRTATFTYKIVNKGVLSLTLAKPTEGVNIGQSYTSLNLPTSANIGNVGTYSATGLPEGMQVNPANGALTGSPSSSIPNNTPYQVTVKLTDDFDGASREVSYKLTVALPILPEPGQRAAYALRIGVPFTSDAPQFTNAVGAVTYVANGRPEGLTGIAIDPNTGVVSGTPIFVAHGTYPNHIPVSDISVRVWNATVTVTDSTGRTGSVPYTLTARRPLTLALANPVVGIDIGRAYSGLNRPTVGQPGGTITYSGTGLPDGLLVNATTGALEGTVANGRYAIGEQFAVTVTATDSFDGGTAAVSYSLTVAEPITVVAGQTTTYAVRVGDALTIDLPKFDNALGDVTYAQSGKPAWMSFSSVDGSSSGTATAASTGTVTVTITDSIKRQATFAYAITSRAALGLAVVPTVNGIDFGKTYAAINRPTASNVAGTATYEDVDGVIASTGLSFNTTTGGLSGTISNNLSHGDVFTAVVRIRDSYDDIRMQLVDKGNVRPPSGDGTPFHREVTYPLTATEAITAVAGQTTSYAVRIGDTLKVDLPAFDKLVGTPTFSQTGKPAWLDFAAADGAASGVATVAANSSVTVTVKDSTSRTATFSYSIVSRAALGLTLTPSVNGLDFGKTYGATNVPAAANVAGTAAYEDVDGLIGSAGLTFNTVTGGFSGQVTSSFSAGQKVRAVVRLRDTYDNLRVQLIQSGNVSAPASDPHPEYRQVEYDLTASDALVVRTGQKAAYVARVGDAVSTDPVVIDNVIGAAQFTATGVPSGLVLDATTGRVSGTVAAAGNYTIVVTARDTTLRTASFSYTLTTKGVLNLALANPVTDIWQSTGMSYAAINRPTATNIGATASYAVVGLPPEFAFSATTGAITGTLARGTYPDGTTFPIRTTVTDSFDLQSKFVDFTLVVRNAPAPTVSISPTPTGYAVLGSSSISTVMGNAKDGDVVALAPGSAPLPPGYTIVKNASGAWLLSKAATTEADLGVYKGINLRVTDVDGTYGETGPFDIILRSTAFLNFATQVVEARADVPLETAPPVPSAGTAMKDLTFSFTTDTTGGSLVIKPKTGELTGKFNKNGTNVVKVVESYDGKMIREFSYNLTLKVVQISVSIGDFAVMSDVLASKQVVTAYGHKSGVYSMTGNVPVGLSINSSTGLITGTTKAVGAYSVNVVYEDDYALVSVPVRITVVGDAVGGHRYWKSEIRASGRGGALAYEVELFDTGNNNVTHIANVVGNGLLTDGDYATGPQLNSNSPEDLVFTFDKKVKMSKAVFTGKGNFNTNTGGTTATHLHYWSDDGVNWTKASTVANVGTSANVATSTAAISN
ncbi:hypothetical protein G6L37_05645 [Agrobacterium rubi]|nr:hypothetical protein [Agrobacterium rubi]NTF24842.1 hypothetical protein [Agrobacterium rubi]